MQRFSVPVEKKLCYKGTVIVDAENAEEAIREVNKNISAGTLLIPVIWAAPEDSSLNVSGPATYFTF